MKHFRRAAALVKVTAVPYQARHSGASLDAARGLRSRAEIKARGRWASDRSVARYESKARVAESSDCLPKPRLQHLQLCEHRLEELLCGRVAAQSLPLPP